jgi:hypothetical protein
VPLRSTAADSLFRRWCCSVKGVVVAVIGAIACPTSVIPPRILFFLLSSLLFTLIILALVRGLLNGDLANNSLQRGAQAVALLIIRVVGVGHG